ncbi:MAG: FxLYD domain-containing protein [Thermodesulfobacteriota bacterium]
MSSFGRSGTRRWALAAMLACGASWLLSSCAATRPEPGEAGARPADGASALGEIIIVDMHEEPASDPSLVKVVGTIVNKTDRPVSRLSVRVEARDAQGRALTRVIAPSLSETIPAQGGTALFEASVPRSKLVNNYYAEVIAQ